MSLSFQTVLQAMAVHGNVTLDTETGLPALSRQEEHRFTAFLNEAATWTWRGLFQQWTLPDTLEGTAVTLATGGVIQAADIDSSTFWSVWETDPRLEQLPDRQRLQKHATQKANGDVLVEGGAAGDVLFVFYRTRVPKWTAVTASAGTVSIGTLLWNKQTSATCGDGHVYRALIADASPDDFTDTASWAPVTLPDRLLDPVRDYALWLKLKADAMPAPGALHRESALAWMDAAALEAERHPAEKPWLYNANA